ncbi:hypothetical protein GCM10020218_051180 [Dactylosporangium vinaceum]
MDRCAVRAAGTPVGCSPRGVVVGGSSSGAAAGADGGVGARMGDAYALTAGRGTGGNPDTEGGAAMWWRGGGAVWVRWVEVGM